MLPLLVKLFAFCDCDYVSSIEDHFESVKAHLAETGVIEPDLFYHQVIPHFRFLRIHHLAVVCQHSGHLAVFLGAEFVHEVDFHLSKCYVVEGVVDFHDWIELELGPLLVLLY